jgi:hypothetical protein
LFRLAVNKNGVPERGSRFLSLFTIIRCVVYVFLSLWDRKGVWLDIGNNSIPSLETVTEPWMTEPRKTEPRKTERRKTETRMTKPRMTKSRIGPNLKWPKLESDRTSNDQTSKRTQPRIGQNLEWPNLKMDRTSKDQTWNEIEPRKWSSKFNLIILMSVGKTSYKLLFQEH